MVERRESTKLEQQKQVLFINNYNGDGASYGDSLEFNIPKLEGFLRRIGSKNTVFLVPEPLDGTSIREKPKFTIAKFLEEKGIVVMSINGRRIYEEITDRKINNPEEIRALFIREFNRNVRGALIDYGGGMNVFAAAKSLFSWPFLFLGEDLVREKADPNLKQR